ncbi:MAG: ParA family protein [Pseudobdellovibrionaceae bacterium]
MEATSELNESVSNKKIETTPIDILKYCAPQMEIAEALGVSTAYISQLIKSLGLKTYKHRRFSYLPSASARALFEAKSFKYPLKGVGAEIIAVQMLKGGAGKTANANNLALRLHHFGARVLLMDMDPQGNSTSTWIPDGLDINVFADVIEKNVSIEDAIITLSEGFDLLPSNFDNTGLDNIIYKYQKNMATFVLNEIEHLRDKYDYIIVDCNPSLSAINTSISLASDKIIVPLNPDKHSADGLDKVINAFSDMELNFKQKLDYRLLLTKFDLRTTTGQEYLLKYATAHSDKTFKTVIRDSKDYATTLLKESTLFLLRESILKEDYDRLAREVLGLQLEPSTKN